MAANRGSQARARAAVLPQRRPDPTARAGGALSGSVRALLAGCALIVLAAGAYMVARQSSLFAIRAIEVRGAPPEVRARVQAALADWRGTSLVGLDGGELLRRAENVPWVERAAYDRAFPNTLRVLVRRERAAAVLRRGRTSWLVSARGRVLRPLPRHAEPALPRIWVPSKTVVDVGATLPDTDGGAAARALAPLVRTSFPARVETAALRGGELVFRLRAGLELRLGKPRDLLLKLAIARRIVGRLGSDVAYLDVSVPERPVAGPATLPPSNPQLSG